MTANTTKQETMRAIVRDRYGKPDVLRLEEIPRPEPTEDQVLIELRASSVNFADWHTLTGTPFLVRMMNGLRRPKEAGVGIDFAGTIVAAGKNVTEFRPGDAVFGESSGGAYAEYLAAPERWLAHKPDGVSFEEAGSVGVAALTALQGLRDHGKLQPGQRVLINGASGGVGTFAVQLAKALGAAEVTAVCHARNVEQARKLGADRVIDYTKEDFLDSDQRYDVILDIVGTQPLRKLKRLLSDEGMYVAVGAPKAMLRLIPRLLGLMMSSKTVFFIAMADQGELGYFADLMAEGELTPAIEQVYPLAKTAAAMDQLGTGHARAKIAITI